MFRTYSYVLTAQCLISLICVIISPMLLTHLWNYTFSKYWNKNWGTFLSVVTIIWRVSLFSQKTSQKIYAFIFGGRESELRKSTGSLQKTHYSNTRNYVLLKTLKFIFRSVVTSRLTDMYFIKSLLWKCTVLSTTTINYPRHVLGLWKFYSAFTIRFVSR